MMRSPGDHSTKRKGPVPTGWRANSAPHFLTADGDTIDTGKVARFDRNGANGRSMVMRTVYGSTASTDWMLRKFDSQ